MKPKELLENHKYVIFAGISTFSLIISTFSFISISKSLKEVSNSLEPIKTWADTQNLCVEKTFRIDGKNTQGIPSKVWSCNGGGN